ncbi:hypothetical protein [Microbacterium caowuchunii]|uniref:Lipoprotein n=1 Tax=Microbacterium caowuchunii TaxID=2614638 RepID=A0A5N0TH36_9MICO|nr:hypothetical protein [Microbacterium caowuchunii]KAA9134405.1 hypothetical protein F6B40_06445 [Microbacterium caowuchunii]
MTRASALTSTAILTLALAGCSGSMLAENRGGDQLSNLRTAIESNADCAELFSLLDQIDEDADAYPSAQGELVNIGCFMRDSTRNDADLAAQAPDSPWLGVPGKEVEPSLTCISAAETAANEADSTRAEPLIAATLDSCQSVDEWMSVITAHPGVMGMMDGYIPQLMDLQSACYSYVGAAVCQDALARGVRVGP